MTKIVVDSNILFSAILNVHSNIGQLLINGRGHYEFYAPKYARTEILEHQDKIKKIAHLDDDGFFELYEVVLKNVIVLNHSILPAKDLEKAYAYCEQIDVDDTIFVAFSEYLNCELWTGDKKLITGLEAQGFKNCISTEQLFKDFIKKITNKK